LFIHQFWHIPFPPPDILRLLPEGSHEAVLRGMLGNDLVEFQTERHAINFLYCVKAFVPEARVDIASLSVAFRGRRISVGAFPISIDVDAFEQMAGSDESRTRITTLRDRHAPGARQLGVAVERVTFIFVCTPSRSDLAAYSNLEQDVTDAVLAINSEFGTEQWSPIVLINENVDADLLAQVYRAADVCIVSSLQDGMNLVAKEFIACQLDERGVLILSRFTGSAEEIDGALLINPFNVDEFVNGIRSALDMPADERRRRMRRMRRKLHQATIFDWIDSIMARCAEIIATSPVAAATAQRRAAG
jgi:trehalose-6-phosphate synthase